MSNKKGRKHCREVQLQDLEFEARLQKLRDWNKARIQEIKKAKDVLKQIYKDDRTFIPKRDKNST